MDKNKLFKYCLIIFILLLATFLYLYKLDQIPSGLYVDEASQGYNAYSVLLTGKDEYGKSFPLVFKLFGSYSPPLYTYLSIPGIKIFGLNNFAVRFVSAISGILLVLLLYLFVKQLHISDNEYLPIIASFIFAISPWEIMFARSGYEANLGLFLFVLSVYLLWRGIENNKYLFVGFIVASLSTYSTFTDRYLVPLFLFVFVVLFKNQIIIKKGLRYLVSTFIVIIVIQIPNIYLFTTPSFFSKTHLFYSQAILTRAQDIFYLPKFIGNIYAFFFEFFSQYFTYFSPTALFLYGDSDLQRSIPTLSVFYSWLLLPYIFGLYKLWEIRKKLSSRLLLLLTFLTPIPAAFAGDPFSSYRALPLLFPLIIIFALGVVWIINKFHKPAIILFFILSIFSLISLWRGYFILLPYERANAWDYGFDQLASKINTNHQDKYLIDISNYGPIYSNLLFFLKYNPVLIQLPEHSILVQNYYSFLDFNQEKYFGNVVIRKLNYQKDIYANQIIVVGAPGFDNLKIAEHKLTENFRINDPSGKLIFVGYKTDPISKCKEYFNLIKNKKIERLDQCDNRQNYNNSKD